MIRFAVALLAFVGATAAQADICQDIRAVTGQTGEITMRLPATGEVTTCTRSLMLEGGAQLHCGWAFPYRAPAAHQAFQALVVEVAECLGDQAQVTADLDVNHPDFYDLQTFQLGDQEIGVSLKDKGALSETYVFLRIILPE